jgi:O-antigen/teichoic acid export membrane protein
MKRDLASAYLATAARIGSWAVVSAIAFRILGKPGFGMLALVRSTVTILNYTSLGLAPAMIALAAQRRRNANSLELSPTPDPLAQIYGSALALAGISAVVGLILVAVFAGLFTRLLNVDASLRGQAWVIVLLMGIGALLRLLSDSSGAAVQSMRRIALDNTLIAAAETSWAILSAVAVFAGLGLPGIAGAYAASGLMMVAGRLIVAMRLTGVLAPRWGDVSRGVLRALLGFGALVVLAQLADYLYAPCDYILINKLIGDAAVATYAPLLQIDAALLVLVSGVAAVLLPKSALAHAAGQRQRIRAYYIRGTLASFALLLVAGAAIWAISPWLFQAWLGDSMPAARAILPLLLIHTIIGGSSAAGRSILLAVGRAWPFAVSALIAGVGNVAMGFVFVKYFGWGLRGIAIGTIIAVTLRCAVWMPWYVMKAMKEAGEIRPEAPPPITLPT